MKIIRRLSTETKPSENTVSWRNRIIFHLSQTQRIYFKKNPHIAGGEIKWQGLCTKNIFIIFVVVVKH